MKKKTFKVSLKLATKLLAISSLIKLSIGQCCVCWLTNAKTPQLMISNLPHNSKHLDDVIAKIEHLFQMSFEVKEIEIGRTVSLVFTPT